MKSLRFFLPVLLAAAWFNSAAAAQTPTITSIKIQDTGCVYTVGVSTTPCKMGPGNTLIVNGTNFSTGGIVSTCDCAQITVPAGKWTATKITGTVNWVYTNPSSGSNGIQVETSGGLWSSAVPYTALGAVITSIQVGSCTYVPNVSSTQCVITAGTQFTINGSYFGPGPVVSGPQVTMCDCSNPTINSWNPNWATSPSPTGNVITATAVVAECGNAITVWSDGLNFLGSNPVPYTTC